MRVRYANSGDIFFLQDFNIFIDWKSLLKDNYRTVWIVEGNKLLTEKIFGYLIFKVGKGYYVEDVNTPEEYYALWELTNRSYVTSRPVYIRSPEENIKRLKLLHDLGFFVVSKHDEYLLKYEPTTQ